MRSSRLAVVLACVLAVPALVVAGVLTVPHAFSNNTVADAVQVNANFTAVKTAVDDNDARLDRYEGTGASALVLKSPDGNRCLKLHLKNGSSQLTTVAVNCTTGAELGLIQNAGAWEIAGGSYLRSCKEYRAYALYAGEGSGVYRIDPDGVGVGEAPVDVYCDMVSDGGTGWTLVLTRSTTKSRTELNSESAFGAAVNDPNVNADNILKRDWSLLGFTEVKYQLNNYATTFWFAGLTTAERDSAKGSLFLNRPAQSVRPSCTNAWGGGTQFSNCGGLSTGHYGWVADPGVTYCWMIHDPTNLGAGNCSNGFGTKGRIWVR